MLIQIAEGRGGSAAEVALAWLLGRPGVTSLIVGARTEDQLRTKSSCGRPGSQQRNGHILMP